jgi:DNA-binding CsgD family transcriptional regulator
VLTLDQAAVAERRVEDLVYSGLGSVELRVLLVAELARVVAFDAAFLPAVDPATLLYTGAVRHGMPEGVTPQFLDNEFHVPDVNKFRVLAQQPRAVATLDAATRGDWSISARYRDIMSPIGLGDELRVVFRTGGTTWGYACLHRAEGARFDDHEVAFIQRVAPHVGEGLRRASLIERAAQGASLDGPGIVMLAGDLSLAAATPAGERWLDELAATERPRSPRLPLAVLAVAQALNDVNRSHDAPRLTVRSASGRTLVLHASRLASPAGTQTAIVIEPASHAQLEPAIVAAYALTPREAQTLALLLRGLPTKQIAAALHITGHTANDHIKSIFDKTGTNSRGGLLATVFHDQRRPA